jgi:hypothetical protein
MPHRKLQKHYDEYERLQTPRLREKDWQRGEVHLPERQRDTVQNGYSSTGSYFSNYIGRGVGASRQIGWRALVTAGIRWRFISSEARLQTM